MNPFHLAIAVNNLESTREFYTEILGCTIGRTDIKWIDFNFFGHQLSAHLKPEEVATAKANEVDGKQVPVKHFGMVLNWQEWENLAKKIELHKVDFLITPYIRFKGEVGEQGTFFIKDPSGNAIEFKTFKDMSYLFKAA